MKTIIKRVDCDHLVELANAGKVRFIKEHGKDGPEYIAQSAGGTPIGIMSKRFNYVIEALLIRIGSGDGLFYGNSQTSLVAK